MTTTFETVKDEDKIEAPQKPLPVLEVDTLVLVWDDTNGKTKRHFSHFKNGRIYTFYKGHTSLTSTKCRTLSTYYWPYWELAE